LAELITFLRVHGLKRLQEHKGIVNRSWNKKNQLIWLIKAL
jgi:hypothetical protein